jgi:FO synthase
VSSSPLTYVRAVSHALSPRCVNRCGFCTYPLRRYRAVPSPKRWRQWLRQARPWEATNLIITGGEPFTKDREMLQTVRYYGYEDAVAYLQALMTVALEEHHGGYLISLELGEVRRADLQRLRLLIADYIVGIVPFDPTLFGTALLWNSPTMVPPRRLELIETLGQMRIPTTVNMLVGLGECESSRVQTLAALAELHARRGHLQCVRITPFRPRVGTALENTPPAEPDVVVRTVRQAAEMLRSVTVQAPAMAVEDYVERCVDAGAQDLGAIAADPTQDLGGIARHWGRIERQLVERGDRLLERLCLTESAVTRGLYPETLRAPIARQLERLEQRHVSPVVSAEPVAGEQSTAGA